MDYAVVYSHAVSSKCFAGSNPVVSSSFRPKLTRLSFRHSTANSNSWFALTSYALGKQAVEGKDGYMILALPQMQAGFEEDEASASSPEKKDPPSRKCVCWKYVGRPWSSS